MENVDAILVSYNINFLVTTVAQSVSKIVLVVKTNFAETRSNQSLMNQLKTEEHELFHKKLKCVEHTRI